MPNVVIEFKKKYARSAEQEIINTVYKAMVVEFEMTANKRTIRLIVHEPDRYSPDPNLVSPDLHTHISIDTFAGRSIVAKRILY